MLFSYVTLTGTTVPCYGMMERLQACLTPQYSVCAYSSTGAVGLCLSYLFFVICFVINYAISFFQFNCFIFFISGLLIADHMYFCLSFCCYIHFIWTLVNRVLIENYTISSSFYHSRGSFMGREKNSYWIVLVVVCIGNDIDCLKWFF